MPFIAWHPIFKYPLPEGHRFQMLKYELLRDQLLYEGVVQESDFISPQPLDEEHLKGVHSKDYRQRLLNLELTENEVRRIGFPLTNGLVERELRIARGTIVVAEAAIEKGIGFNIAGGTHHAGSNWGEGFCLFNDQAIAAHYLLNHYGLKQILIIDLDVHQGNGTAEIFEDEDRVFTFSMHGRNNFPFKKEESDRDIGLADNTRGERYLSMLKKNLDSLFSSVQPDFVFFQAGADVLKTDKLGRLNLTLEDCKRRDKMVFDCCKQSDTPVQVSMGGGYSEEIKYIVNAHCQTYKEGISTILY